MVAQEIPLDQLLLDPNNFRFQGETGTAPVASRRFADTSVQDAARSRHLRDGITDLRASIVENGYLQVDRIVVKPHTIDDVQPEFYIVVEGNRRVSTLKLLRDELAAGVELPPGLVAVFDKVPCVVLQHPDRAMELSIMGVRHVGGIKEWGGYQGAKIVAILKDEERLSTAEVASRLGLSAQEVNRRYRAYSAVEAMRNDEEYGEHVTSEIYTLLHEAVSARVVREHFGWSTEDETFADEERARELYRLITPFVNDDGVRKPPKITKYTEVRGLKALVSNSEALESLHDLEQDISHAHAIVVQETERHNWRAKLRSALKAIGGISLDDFAELDETAINDLETFRDKLDRVLTQARNLHVSQQ